MICKTCGKEIRDGAKGCPYCGRPTSNEDRLLFKLLIACSVGFIAILCILAILYMVYVLVMMIKLTIYY